MDLPSLEDFKRLERKVDLILEALQTGKGKASEPPAQDWVNGRTLRQKYGWDTNTLQSFRKNGTLTGKKVGGRWYYKTKDVQKLIK